MYAVRNNLRPVNRQKKDISSATQKQRVKFQHIFFIYNKLTNMKKLPIYLLLLFLVLKGCEAQQDLQSIEAKDYTTEAQRSAKNGLK